MRSIARHALYFGVGLLGLSVVAGIVAGFVFLVVWLASFELIRTGFAIAVPGSLIVTFIYLVGRAVVNGIDD